jgi:hypothetical protein
MTSPRLPHRFDSQNTSSYFRIVVLSKIPKLLTPADSSVTNVGTMFLAMFKRSAGWNTEKTGSVSWTKPVAKRGGNPCLSDPCKSGSNEQDAEVGWPTRPRRISAIRSKRLYGLPRGEPFEHEADGRQVDEGFRSFRTFNSKFLLKRRFLREPRKRALHDPSQGPPP